MSDQLIKTVYAVVFKSINGRDDWKPVKPADVPEWVRDPARMARMMGGEMVMLPTDGPKGSAWYRLDQISEPVTLQ